MIGLGQDLRFTARTLLKSKAFTLVAVLALALGIGGTTVMYSAVNGVLLGELPYPQPDRLVRLWAKSGNGGTGSVSWQDFLDWKAQSKSVELMAGFSQGDYTLAHAGQAERIPGSRVTADFFALLGARPILGRAFGAEAFVHGTELVLSNEVWRQSFSASPDVVGQAVRLSDKTYSVVGILPPGFQLPGSAGGVYLPYVPDEHAQRGNHFLNVLGRLAPGASRAQASAELETIAASLAAAYPDSNKDRSILTRLWSESLTENLRPAILLLFGAVLLVLVIACANVANMLIARAASRQTELALRFALGATRLRVIRQLLTECLVLAVAGGLGGVLIAVWGVGACRAILPPSSIFAIGLDAHAFLFAGVAVLASVLVFGLVPAVQATRGDLAGVMKAGARTVAHGRSRLRSLLVVVQVALSFALLAGATLLGRSFASVAAVPAGFDPTGVLTLQIALPESKDPALFYQRLLDRVQAIPQVTSAGLVDFLPLAQNNISGPFAIEGKTIDDPNASTECMIATPDYMKTMGMSILHGRGLAAGDVKDGQPVVVINQAMARKYFGADDAVGKRMRLEWTENAPWSTVVGVVADSKRRALDREAVPETFTPFAQVPWRNMTLTVKGQGDLGALAAAIRREVASVDPEQAVFNVATMSRVVDDSLRFRRLLLDFTGVFGAVALLLAAVGLYGVLAVQVAQRTHELGIRMALGAQPKDVRALVVKNGVFLTLAGTVVGAATAILLSSLLGKLLYGVAPTDPVTFIGVGLLLVGVSILAAWVPARRATRIDPMTAFRGN